MYNKVPANMNFVEREKNIEKFWEDEQIFKKSIDSRKQGPTYTFYDGPPTANGKPHIGHVLTRVISMVWSRSSSTVKRVSGNTKECGRNSPTPLVSGQTWSIRMLPTTTASLSLSGGH